MRSRTLFLALVAGTLLFSLAAAPAATLTLISIKRGGSAIVITFQAAQGATYSLERKLAITDPTWQSISGVNDLTAINNGSAQITDPGGGNLGKAFYQVSLMSTASPTPSPNPRPTPARDVWISIRSDGLAGSGTQADPYDGSTMTKFDNLMTNFQSASALAIHLGAGTFRTKVGHTWYVKASWAIDGEGIDVTTVQVGGAPPRWLVSRVSSPTRFILRTTLRSVI